MDVFNLKQGRRIFAVSGLSLVLLGCNQAVSETVTHSVQPVKVLEVNLSSHQQSQMIAYLDAADRSELSFQVGGYLAHLHVYMGQKVEKGDVIAELDAQDYQLALNIKQAEYDLASANFERANRLYKQALISKDAYENALSGYESARALLRVAKNDLKNTRLYADFDGVIASKSVNSFQVVGAGQTIVSLVDPEVVEAKAVLPVDLYNQLNRNALLNGDYKLTVAGNNEVSYSAKFKEISNQPDADTNSYELTLTTKGMDKRVWVPGMSAQVTLTQDTDTYGLYLEESAWVSKEENSGQIFVYDPEEKVARLQRVTLNNQGAITAGVKSGDLIVVAGTETLREGQAVRLWEQEGGI